MTDSYYMKERYPESWGDLQFFWRRAELLSFLKDCRDRTHYETEDEINFDVHFFFDDHDFADDPEGLIGYILFDDKEVDLIKAFVSEYGKVINLDFKTVDWAPVMASASHAYDYIVQNRA